MGHLEGHEVVMERRMVSPEMAKEWLHQNRYPFQRRLSEPRVKEFMAYLQTGEWALDVIRFHEVTEPTAALFLTDGQHRLTAIDRTGLPAPFLLHRYQVQTMAQVHRDYGYIDTPKLRTLQDVLPGTGLGEESGLNLTQLSRLSAGVRLITAGFRSIQANSERIDFRSNTHRIDQIRDWTEEATQYFAAIEGRQVSLGSPLLKQPVLAVALETFRHQPDKAEEFWSSVARNDGLHRGDPEWLLVELLVGEKRRRLDPPHLARLVAAAWNAFFEERRLQLLKCNPADDITIKGTTWKGPAKGKS